jgi:hypothetical protein
MVLALITPLGTNFIKDFSATNSVNCDLIDAYAGPYAIQAYTPIFTAVNTNPAIGATGVLTGFYYRIFDQIFTWGEFKFNGAGSNKGSGTYAMTLPFNAKTVTPPNAGSGGGPILGSGVAYRGATSSLRQPVTVQLRTINQIMFSVRMNSGAVSRALNGDDIPFAWANGDGIKWAARYQRDPN